MEERMLQEGMNTNLQPEDYPFARIHSIWTRLMLWTRRIQDIKESFWNFGTGQQIPSTGTLNWTNYTICQSDRFKWNGGWGCDTFLESEANGASSVSQYLTPFSVKGRSPTSTLLRLVTLPKLATPLKLVKLLVWNRKHITLQGGLTLGSRSKLGKYYHKYNWA